MLCEVSLVIGSGNMCADVVVDDDDGGDDDVDSACTDSSILVATT